MRACLRQPLDRLSLKGKIDSTCILKQALYNQQNYKKNIGTCIAIKILNNSLHVKFKISSSVMMA